MRGVQGRLEFLIRNINKYEKRVLNCWVVVDPALAFLTLAVKFG